MVTKHICNGFLEYFRLILAKIHMVTKPCNVLYPPNGCLILAKIHMVTKR